MKRLSALVISVLLGAWIGRAADAPPAIEITVELYRKGSWTEVDKRTVFVRGDAVRFRVKPAIDAYLYVVNHGTSGRRALIFPVTDSESGEVKVEAGKPYMVPQPEEWYRIAGPAGYDRIYWILSPVSMKPAPAEVDTTEVPDLPPLQHPRCDDKLFRTRGECVDRKAGAKELKNVPGAVVYELRLAHR
jgi:hypothetical protein